MIKKCHIFYPCIFLIVWLTLVYADTVPPTFLQGCDALDHDRTILCFGGTSGSVDVMKDFRPTTQFYSLDVSQALTPNQAKENWKAVPLPNNFELEPRAEFAHAIVNVTNWLITSGAGSGTNYSQPTLVNNTVFYDMKANQWHSYAPSTLSTDGVSKVNPISDQLLGVSMCSQSNNKTGITPAVFTTGGVSLTNATMFDTNTSAYYVSAPLDDYWNTLATEGMEKPGRFLRSFRELCAFTDRFRIFVFGGFAYNGTTDAPYYTGVDNTSQASPFEQKGFFDIQSNTNNISNLPANDYVPTVRYWHSLTPIPKVGKIIMYGGVFNNAVSRDYCLLFDIDVRLWSLCDFGNSTNVPGPRYGHSAVMVGDDTLYILSGADANHQLLNDVQILNVTSMRWLDANANSTNVEAVNNATALDSSPPLSPGQIAGVVIGVVAGVSLIIVGAVIYFCMWKKKKNAEQLDVLPAPAFLSAADDQAAQKVLISDDNQDGTHQYAHQHGDSIKPSESYTAAMKPAEPTYNSIKPTEEKI